MDNALIEVMNVEQEILVALNNISDTADGQEALVSRVGVCVSCCLGQTA